VAATFGCNSIGQNQVFYSLLSCKELGEMPGEGLGVGGDAGEGEGEPSHLHHLLYGHTLQI
jgi:hypothetical protein